MQIFSSKKSSFATLFFETRSTSKVTDTNKILRKQEQTEKRDSPKACKEKTNKNLEYNVETSSIFSRRFHRFISFSVNPIEKKLSQSSENILAIVLTHLTYHTRLIQGIFLVKIISAHIVHY